jgi:hypothetical protein
MSLISFFLPWVSSPFLSLGYGLSGSFDQSNLSGGELLDTLRHAHMTLNGPKTITGGPALSYSMLLIMLCLLFSLGASFYRARTPVAERNIGAALLGTGVLGALVVVTVCAVYRANFKPPTFGDVHVGYFRIRYGAICSLLGNIAIVVGGYMMLAVAKANSAAPPEPPETSGPITSLDLNWR